MGAAALALAALVAAAVLAGPVLLLVGWLLDRAARLVGAFSDGCGRLGGRLERLSASLHARLDEKRRA